MLISIPFLLITFFVNAVVPELRNLHGRSLMCYVASLMFLYVLLILSQNCQQYMTGGSVSCRLLASFSYFFSMSFFFWLNVMCYDIYSTFRESLRYRKIQDKNRFTLYCLYAFGSATFLTIALYIMDSTSLISEQLRPQMGTEICWFKNIKTNEFFYFYYPILLIFCTNISLYSITAYHLYKFQIETSSLRTGDSQTHSKINAEKERFYLYLRLFILSGGTWSMEFVSWAFGNNSFFIIFDLLNCIQGFLIFIMFVCKPKVKKLLMKRLYEKMRLQAVIAVVFIFITQSVCLKLECDFVNTVNITAGHPLKNGSYEFENVIYDEGMFMDFDYIIEGWKRVYVTKHRRGCICAVKPCIRICNNYADDHHIKVYDEDEIEQTINLRNNTDYHIMTHAPCKMTFELNSVQDKWIMYKNGSIKVDDEYIVDSQNFCFSNKTAADQKTTVHYCETESDVKEREDMEEKLKWNAIGMFISFPFLLVTFSIYCWIPELRNVNGRSLMCYVASLIFYFGFIIFVQLFNTKLSGTVYCKLSGYGIYFSSILCFFWLNVMSYDIWSTFRGRMRGYRKLADNKRFVVYFAYAFGSTTLLTLIVMFLDEVFDVPEEIKPIIGIERCWIRSDRLVEFLYVYFPMSIISVVNIILYSMTAYKIYICQKELASMKTEDFQKHSSVNADKDKFYLYLRLFIIMGVTWVMESVSWVFENSSYMFVFTDALNCLQGFIIFFLFVWKPKVIELIKKRWASSPLRCSKSRADLPINTRCSEVTTKSSLDDYEMRG
ncbi:unnamed protein product [Diamesa tonsa]